MVGNLRKLLLAAPLAVGLLGIAPPDVEEPASAPPAAARPDLPPLATYDPDRAGHPLRIIAYAVHPVGVVLDYLILRPCYWLASHEPLRTLVGFDD